MQGLVDGLAGVTAILGLVYGRRVLRIHSSVRVIIKREPEEIPGIADVG